MRYHTLTLAVREELGLSVSVGVSFNKVFAKLASDLKKPDAVSVVDRSNFRDKIYGLPVTDLLFVGKSMAARLEKIGVRTIGALAAAEPAFLQSYLGKWGQTLSTYARGEDDSPVRHIEEAQELKSIGNSTTWREDILNLSDVKRVLYILSESVASRLKDAGLGKANTVHLWVRDRDLNDYSYQKKVRPTALCGEIAQEAYALFCEHYALRRAVRGLGVTVSAHIYCKATLGYILAKKMLANSKNCSIINKHEFLCKISAAGKLPPYRP